jgi:hypothetical protein
MGEASDRSASILRGQWEDYKVRFQPIEGELMSAYGNKALVDQSIGTAQNFVNQAFDASAGIRQRELSRFGLAETADQAMVNDRKSKLARTASLADAANFTRDRAKDRDKEIAAGGIPSGGRTYGLYEKGA